MMMDSPLCHLELTTTMFRDKLTLLQRDASPQYRQLSGQPNSLHVSQILERKIHYSGLLYIRPATCTQGRP